MNSQQQMIMKIMPFFLPVISFTLPAGLVVYFVASNLLAVGQQAFITRTLYAHTGNSGGRDHRHEIAPASALVGHTDQAGEAGKVVSTRAESGSSNSLRDGPQPP